MLRSVLLTIGLILFSIPAHALTVCVNTKTGVARFQPKAGCNKKTESPLTLEGTATHWSTTQNVAATGKVEGAAAVVSPSDSLGALCQNSDIPVGVETPVAQASSVNAVDSNPFDVVLNGQVLLKESERRVRRDSCIRLRRHSHKL